VKKQVSLVGRRVADALNRIGKDSVYTARTGDEDTSSVVNGFVSTGCTGLDYYLGAGAFRGGFPLGRVVELYGAESAGKSTLAIHALISAQRGHATYLKWKYEKGLGLSYSVERESTPPGVAVLLDFECSFDRMRAQRMGLDLANLNIVDNLETLEDGFEAVSSVIDVVNGDKKLQDVPVVVVWDTIAAAATREEWEAEFGYARPGGKSVKMFNAMRKLISRLAKSKVSLICVNQVIDNIGQHGYGPQTKSPGGRALKFMATYRLSAKYIGKVLVGERPIGINTVVQVTKAKLCDPFHELTVPIRFSTGIDDDLATAMFLSDAKRHFPRNEGPISEVKKRFNVKLKSGKVVSAAIAKRGVTQLFDSYKGLRARMHRSVRDWWAAQQEPINASEAGQRAL